MTQNSNQTRFSFQFKISILLISSLFSMPACRKVIQPGHYEGNLLRSVETKYQVEPIEFEVSYPRVDRAAVEVKSKSAETISHIVITRPKKHHLLVTLDGAYPGEYLLERIPQKKTSPVLEVLCDSR